MIYCSGDMVGFVIIYWVVSIILLLIIINFVYNINIYLGMCSNYDFYFFVWEVIV